MSVNGSRRYGCIFHKPRRSSRAAVSQNWLRKPPILTSTTRSTVQPTLLKVLKPIISDSKERCTKKEDTGGDLLSCANSIACNPEECDLTRNNSTVNNIAAIRRGRVTKAPKPLPYLVPISTRSDQRSVGRSLSSLGQRRVTFAATSKRFQRRRRRRVERTRSEKSTRIKKPVLAYLVVDLESGALARSLGKNKFVIKELEIVRAAPDNRII